MSNSETFLLCQAAKPYYYDYLCGQLSQIPQDIYTHIAACPACQNEVQWLKEADDETDECLQAIAHTAQMQLHCALLNQPVRCSTIKSFLPTLLIPDMDVRVSTPVTEHIKACPDCTHDLEVLRQLKLSPEQLASLTIAFTQQPAEQSEECSQNIMARILLSQAELRAILNRPDSGIVTCFRPKDHSDSKDTPAFTVEVTHEPPISTPAAVVTAQPIRRQKPAASNRPGWLFKSLAAAAAILVITVLLFHNTTVVATDIGQIYNALKEVQQVKIIQYDADSTQPLQTVWISHSRGIKMVKTKDELTWYDLSGKIRKIKPAANAEIQQIPLDDIAIKAIQSTMDIPWGLLPFTKTSDLPKGAIWTKIASEESDPVEIYNLDWTDKSLTNDTIEYQWRCYADAKTKRPIKVEWRTKTVQTPEFELTNYSEITYPTADQVQQAIDEAGF